MKEPLYQKAARAVRSFIMNVLFWVLHFYKLPGAICRKRKISKGMRGISDLRKELAGFVWTKDDVMDWTPWVITFIARDKRDDCDGAAIYGLFLLECLGVGGSILHLRGPSCGHAVCVSNSGMFMVSNRDVVRVKGRVDDFVLRYFGGKYTHILR